MEMNVIKCPNCGASSTNHTNCEYCGSLLVRFVDKGIDLSTTSYLTNDKVYAGLIEGSETRTWIVRSCQILLLRQVSSTRVLLL